MKKWLLPALVFALAGAPAPSSATILFAGGEDTSFTLYGGAAVNGSGVRTGFSRETIYVVDNNTTDPPPFRFETPTFTAVSALWIHGQVFPNTPGAALNGQQAVLVRSPDGVSRIVVRLTSTNNQLKISTRNAAGTLTDLATMSGTWSGSDSSTWPFDLYINYTCSGSGQVILYLSGVQVINYTGNPCTNSATQLNQVGFAAIQSNTNTTWSEIIIADQDTRSMALWTRPPVAAGNTQLWTPNTAGDINEGTINDANSISTPSSDVLSEWTGSATIPSGSWNVLAVVQEARVEAATTGPQHFGWVARTGGSDYVSGSVAPLTGFSNFNNQIWATNPNTGVAWTTSDVTAAGFNLGIESLN